VEWLARSPDDMESIGAALAVSMPPARTCAIVVYLQGDLGAGKTTLARGFLHALGIAGTIRSPSYALVETYDAGELQVLHVDLYRLRDGHEFENLGLREADSAGRVWLVEWPEKAEGRLPSPTLCLLLTAEQQGHRVVSRSSSAPGMAWLNSATPELSRLSY